MLQVGSTRTAEFIGEMVKQIGTHEKSSAVNNDPWSGDKLFPQGTKQILKVSFQGGTGLHFILDVGPVWRQTDHDMVRHLKDRNNLLHNVLCSHKLCMP